MTLQELEKAATVAFGGREGPSHQGLNSRPDPNLAWS